VQIAASIQAGQYPEEAEPRVRRKKLPQL